MISKLKFELSQLSETNEQSIINLQSFYNKQLVKKYKKFSILENHGFQLTSGLKKYFFMILFNIFNIIIYNLFRLN